MHYGRSGGRWVWLIGLLGLVAAVGIAYGGRALLSWLSAVPLDATTGSGQGTETLPAGCLVATVSAETTVQAPFAVVASAASPSGFALVLAEGRGNKDRNAGRGAFPIAVPSPGRYRLWLRCRWSNACGNSVAVAVDDGEPATVGQDLVLDLWHWVDAGEHDLAAGTHAVNLVEREDGVSVDQILLCPAAAPFVPTGPILAGQRQGAGRREFADGFDRSPGHGNEGWNFRAGTWDIAFSLDPNRIPLQYALTGTPGAAPWAVAAVAGPDWRGASVDLAFRCDTPGTAVGVWFASARGAVAVTLGPRPAAAGPDAAVLIALDDVVPEPGQWYRLQVERWAWSVRVRLDGREVHRRDGLPTAECGVPALLVAGGLAVFDDVAVSEVPWQADDGRDFRLAWTSSPDARWYRPRYADADWALSARQGALRLGAGAWPIAEVVVEAPDAAALARLHLPGFAVAARGPAHVFLPEAEPPADLALTAAGTCRLRRLAVRQAPPEPAADSPLGVYHFSEASIPDIADYLDFTPDEYRQIAASSDAERLRRQAKHFDLVGASTDYAVWHRVSGSWRVDDGVLRGAGREATLRFWQEINGPFRVQFRVRLADAQSVMQVVLAEALGQGHVLRLAAPEAAPGAGTGQAAVSPAAWHTVSVELTDASLLWRVDEGDPGHAAVERGTAGGVLLRLEHGQADVDDILFALPRRTDSQGRRSRFYAFDRREPDWWRRGPWLDHGGIACAVASSWISLEALDAEGYLVHKDTFGPDVQVALNAEESTEWFGWDREPSHRHHPADNLHILLLPANRDTAQGYRLAVNRGDDRVTALYRNGTEVAKVVPDRDFPMQYVGGHAPYRPRRNRIALIRQGDQLRALINGVEVLAYRDPQPLATATVAIGGSHTRVNFSNVMVRELPPPSGR